MNLVRSTDEVDFSSIMCYVPDEIVDKVKINMQSETQGPKNDFHIHNRENKIGDEDTSVNNFIQKNMSQLALANAVIEHNKINLVPEMGAFLV